MFTAAFTKGLASAVVLTAGLAAGAAQAADPVVSGDITVTEAGSAQPYTVVSGEVSVNLDTDRYVSSITVNDGASLTLNRNKNAEDTTDVNITVAGDITLQGGDLTLQGKDKYRVAMHSVSGDAISGKFVSTNADVVLADAGVNVASVNITGGSLSVSGTNDNTENDDYRSFIQAYGTNYGWSGENTGNKHEGYDVNSADVNITNATVKVGKVGAIAALDGLTFRGSDIEITGGSGSYDEAYLQSSQNGDSDGLVIEDSKLAIKGGKTIFYADNTTLDAVTFSVDKGATLNILGIPGHEAGKANVEVAGGSVDNKGTINISGDLTVDTLKGWYSAEGSNLAVSGDVTQTGSDAVDLTATNFTNSATAGGETSFTAAAASVTIDNTYNAKFDTVVGNKIVAQGDGENFTISGGSTVKAIEGLSLAAAEAEGAEKASAPAAQAEEEDVQTITVNGTLVFGSDTAVGADLGAQKYIVTKDNSSAASLKFIGGDQWKVQNITVESGGAFALEDGALQVDEFVVQGETSAGTGTANINGGELTAETMTVGDSGSVTVNAGTVNAGNFSVAENGEVSVGGTEQAALNITSVGEDGVQGSITAANLGVVTLSADALEDISDDDGNISGGMWAASKVSLEQGSKLVLDTAKEFDDAAAISTYVNSLSTTANGLIDLEDATIKDFETDTAGFITTTERVNLSNITTNQLKELTAVVDADDTISGGQWNGIASADDSAEVQGTTYLTAKDDYFAYQYEDGTTYDFEKVANISVKSGETANLTLMGNGQAGNVSGSNPGTADDVLNFIDGDAVSVKEITNFKEVNVNSVVSAAGIDDVDTLNVNNTLTVTNESGDASVSIEKLNVGSAGRFTVDALTLEVDTDPDSLDAVIEGVVDAGSVHFTTTSTSGSASITGTLFADTIDSESANGFDIYVGQAGAAEGDLGKNGYMEVGYLNLSGGSLIVDPEYGTASSIVAVMGGVVDGERVTDDVKINGNAFIGQNSVAGFGISLADLKSAVGKYFVNNGGLDSESIGAIGYFNKTYTVESGQSLVIDSTKDANAFTTGTFEPFQLGANSAMIVSADLTDAAKLDGSDVASVVHIAGTVSDGDILADKTSQVIFDSTEILGRDSVQLFTDENGTTTMGNFDKNDFGAKITAANGLLTGEIQSNGSVLFTLDKKAAETALYNQSNPVKAMTINVMANEGDVDDRYDIDDLGVAYIAAMNAHKGGQAIEETARLAVYAGAVQATYMAQQTSTDAVADRLGIANPNSNLVYADNLNGGGIWLAPIYKNHDSDEFDAQGVDYGADIDLYGVALGADFTTDSGVRVGAYFNVGSGDADGQGVG
ncbi:MAG: hypothetical protein IAB19_05715, partial [Proteobacteria bacterium]|nr:hypothetical protein [Candidatus Avisuccinivibrio stercorigallinarum]